VPDIGVRLIMEKKDAITVLSSRLTLDRKLNKESKKRIEKGVKLFRKGMSSYIIMNGGPGLFTDGTYVPRGTHPVQCEVMKEYALSLGIQNDRILIQDYSSDTVGEAYFVKKMILETRKMRNIVIVTSVYHMKRARIIYEQILGADYFIEFVGVKTELDSDPNVLEKEKRSLSLFLRQFGELEPGDSERIEQTLYNCHSLYMEIPERKRLRFY
jgi:uncharacterized SAM-binding protein YcdF (DUF218 family)